LRRFDVNRENLEKLATYLESLPKDYEHFCMETYFTAPDWDGEKEVAYALHNGGLNKCDAVACAIGHGPAAGILALPEEIMRGSVCWDDYCKRVFCDVHSEDNLTPEYKFLFYDAWEDYDNTPLGAAQRIRYLLAGNAPLEVGDLSYKETVA
jgi:hypothetical protein